MTEAGIFDESLVDTAAFAAVAALGEATVTFAGDAGMNVVSLHPGEVHRIRRDDTFIGTLIDSNTPIALLVGAPNAFIPYHHGPAQPLLMPVAPPIAWGHEYAAVRYPDRYPGTVESVLYRIVAERDGTALEYDPIIPDGAKALLQAGELSVVASSVPFVVRSQDAAHPFHLSVMMTANDLVKSAEERERELEGRGGPELVAVPPVEEYASRFAFEADHSYPDTHLVLVRKRVNGSYADVSLDCAGTIKGWQPIDTADGAGATWAPSWRSQRRTGPGAIQLRSTDSALQASRAQSRPCTSGLAVHARPKGYSADDVNARRVGAAAHAEGRAEHDDHALAG